MYQCSMVIHLATSRHQVNFGQCMCISDYYTCSNIYPLMHPLSCQFYTLLLTEVSLAVSLIFKQKVVYIQKYK